MMNGLTYIFVVTVTDMELTADSMETVSVPESVLFHYKLRNTFLSSVMQSLSSLSTPSNLQYLITREY